MQYRHGRHAKLSHHLRKKPSRAKCSVCQSVRSSWVPTRQNSQCRTSPAHQASVSHTPHPRARLHLAISSRSNGTQLSPIAFPPQPVVITPRTSCWWPSHIPWIPSPPTHASISERHMAKNATFQATQSLLSPCEINCLVALKFYSIISNQPNFLLIKLIFPHFIFFPFPCQFFVSVDLLP